MNGNSAIDSATDVKSIILCVGVFDVEKTVRYTYFDD